MSMSMSMSMSMAGGGGGALPPFGHVPAELGFRPLTLAFDLGPGAIPSFPPQSVDAAWSDKLWDPDLVGLLATIEFAAMDWQKYAFPDGEAAADYKAEIPALLDLMQTDRERYLQEIIAQHDNAPLYWLSMMGITQLAKPYTFTLLHIALRIGEMAVVFYKKTYKRPRPSQICPGLFPPFGPPGHPAFPSGHSTQGWLMSYCLLRCLPDQATRDQFKPHLKWLAKRVARNRERAGLHYKSDSLGGRSLAKFLMSLLMDSPPASKFHEILGLAQEEWALPEGR